MNSWVVLRTVDYGVGCCIRLITSKISFVDEQTTVILHPSLARHCGVFNFDPIMSQG